MPSVSPSCAHQHQRTGASARATGHAAGKGPVAQATPLQPWHASVRSYLSACSQEIGRQGAGGVEGRKRPEQTKPCSTVVSGTEALQHERIKDQMPSSTVVSGTEIDISSV